MQFFGDQELVGKESSRRNFIKWCSDRIYETTTWVTLIFLVGATFLMNRLAKRIKFKKELENAVALQEASKLRFRGRSSSTSSSAVAGLEAVAELKVTQSDELGEEELKVQQETREKVKQYFRDKPEEASSLLKVWLAENGSN